jgi:hypothetical protein
MAEKKTWWDKLPEPLASIKGNALWAAIYVVVGTSVSGFFTSKIFNQSLIVAAYITLAGVGIAFAIGGVISFFRAMANKAAVEGMCSVIIGDCIYLLKTYKRLDYENRQRVRNPLHKSACPDFGQPWDLYAAELYCGRDNFRMLQLKVEGIWKLAERADAPVIVRLADTAVMLDVIEALDDLLAKLNELKK